MDDKKRDKLVEEKEHMTLLRRNIGALKTVTENLNKKLEDDLDELKQAKKQTDFSISALDRTLLRMKRVSAGSFTLILVLATAGIGLLLFLSFLFL